MAVETIFYARNVRSALKLGHARGVALLAASEAGLPVMEYAPAEIKRAVVGYGRAEKHQVQQMIKLLLGLDAVPSPHDAADALAVAICHMQSASSPRAVAPGAAATADAPDVARVRPSLVSVPVRRITRDDRIAPRHNRGKAPNRLIVDVEV